MVRIKTFNKSKKQVVVQNPKDFSEVAKRYLEKTNVIFISEEQIHQYISVYKTFEGSVIFIMHVIESTGIFTKLWRNASYISNAPDITVKATASEVGGPAASSDFNELVDWAIFSYLLYNIPRVNSLYFPWNH